MTFDINGGNFADNSCQQGSPNRYLHLTPVRPDSGFISGKIGCRTRDDFFGQRQHVGLYFLEQKVYASRGFPSGILSGASPSQQLEIIKKWKNLN